MDLPIVPVMPKNKLEEKIAEIALMFDFTATKTIDCNELGSVMRFLGCAPSKHDLEKICKATEFEQKEYKGFIPIATLMEYVVELLIEKKMKPATSEELFKAFLVFDPHHTGTIDIDYFRQIMCHEGEPITEEEFKRMMKIAIDPESGLIEYEFYISKLLCRDFTAYEMADAMLKEREAIKAAQQKRNLLYKKF